MPDNNSWAERRLRMVKCKKHGLHYDPEMSTGCTRCLKEAAKVRTTRPPQLVLILLCLLGMAFILLYIFGLQSGVFGAPNLGIATISSVRVQLDPEPFRLQVEALESALFRTPIEETNDLLFVSADISATTSDLSSAILDVEPVAGLTAADLIARIGQAIPSDQVVMNDIQLARIQWLRVREQQLLPAAWLYKPSEGAAGIEQRVTASYSDIAADLRALIEEGADQAELLNEPTNDLDQQERTESWREFASKLRERIDRLESRLPPRPGTRASGELLAAVQDLEQALIQARALASEPNLPTATDSRFDATNIALRAQQGFDDAGQ